MSVPARRLGGTRLGRSRAGGAAFVAALALVLPVAAQEEPREEGNLEEREEWLFRQRAFPLDHVPAGARVRALQEAEAFDHKTRGALAVEAAGRWASIGPGPIVKGQLGGQPYARDMSGRVATIAVDPRNSRHWLVGAAQGGIWESTDSGSTWTPRTDDQVSLAMGAIAFTPSDPSVVYAGTGEASMATDAYAGGGLLKSTDGGTKWSLVASRFAASSFSDVVVSPTDPNLVYAATAFGLAGRGRDLPPSLPARGLLRSTDGGQSFSTLLLADATDLKAHPNDFKRMYAGIGNKFLVNDQSGVWRTKDGVTFTQMRGPWKTDSPMKIGRVETAIAPSKPDVVYVGIHDQSNGQLLGLWRTDNAWADPEPAWTKVETKDTNGVDSNGNVLLGYCQGQCSYDHVLLADLVDPDTLYAGGIGLWKCQTCRATEAKWSEISKTGTTPTAPVDKVRGIHVDQHTLAWIKQAGQGGPASFQSRTGPTVEGIPSGNPPPGDYDGDGKMDLVFFDFVDKKRGVVVTQLGNGDGTFRALPSQIVFDNDPSLVPLGGAVADFDADGKLDLVLEMQGKGVALLLGKGDGTFQTKRDVAISAYPLFIGTADMNGDGKVDVVFLEFANPETGAGANAIRILYGDGHGAFPTTRTLNLPFAPLSFVAADVNGDGTVDLVTANYGGDLGTACSGESGSTGTVTLLAAKPDGSFPTYQTLLSGPQLRNIALGDFTGDGKPDIAVTRGTGAGQQVLVLPGNGDGTFQSCKVITLRDKLDFALPGPLLAADVNGDCLTDLVTFFCETLVVINGVPQGTRALEMYVLVNNGDGTLTRTTTTLSLCTVGAALADVNADGRPDVVIGGFVDGPPVAPAVGLFTNGSTATCGGKLVVGNDGGVWSSADAGASFFDHNTNLAITQFFGGSLHPSNPDFALGNAQDNGTQKYSGAPGWPWVDYGDGADSILSSNQPDTSWGVVRQNLFVFRTRDGATFTEAFSGIPAAQKAKAPFVSRLAKCPRSDGVVVAGAEHVLRSTDFFTGSTVTWTDIGGGVAGNVVTALTVAPSDDSCGTYAFGTDEGDLGVTADYATTWRDLDPMKLVPGRWVTDLAFDPADRKTLYVTLSGFDEGTPGAPGHLFKTTNALDPTPSWTRIGPPVNVPFNALAVDPKDGRNLYLGTDIGVFVSNDAGATWARMGPETGMPNVAVFELQFGQETGRVGAFTHGRGAFLLAPGKRTADVSITKRHDPASVLVGKTLTYTLVATNAGPDDATAVTVTDTLPATVAVVSVATSQGSCGGTTTVACGLGSLKSGASATMTIAVTASQAGVLVNTARVAANEEDPNPADNTATDTAQAAALAITKLTPSSAPQGTRSLSLVVEGSGFVPATVVSFSGQGIQVVPPSPPDFGYVSPTELRRTVDIAADAPLGEREVGVTNPDGASGGIRPFNVFTVTPGAIPRIDVSPTSLDFGAVPVGQSADRSLAVRNVGSGPLVVRAIAATNAAYRVVSTTTPLTVPAGGQATVTIRFTPKTSGSAPAVLVVSNSDPSRLALQVSLSGTGNPAAVGALDVNPGALHFGSVSIGQTRSAALTVRNTGNGTLNVGAPSIDNGRFTISPAGSLSLPQGASQAMTVSFAPTAAGAQSATLTFVSNDPLRPTVTVLLRGDGASPASSEDLATDDGTVETGAVGDGLAIVNRLTPSSYP
ncbi:MAG TPA: choice-of-anchor D domain-containing protein, partial [Thermoanaerobaculia bacterium]|nr:choice-of-anchor D domain-containing protein [Thermoanaerobaculia bacterium]